MRYKARLTAVALLALALALAAHGCGGDDDGLDGCIDICEEQADCGGDCADGDCGESSDDGGSFLGDSSCDDMCEDALRDAERRGCGQEFEDFMTCLSDNTDGCALDVNACQNETNAFTNCGSI